MNQALIRLLAPRFVVTMAVIIAASVLLGTGALGPSEWITAALGAGGVYTLGGAPAKDQIKALD